MSVKDRDGRDDHDDRSLTAKRLKRVNVEDPLSAFPSKTKTKSGHIPASEFTKSQWNSLEEWIQSQGNSWSRTCLGTMIG